MDYFKARPDDLEDVVMMAGMLWTDHDPEECRQHFSDILNKQNCPVFLCQVNGKTVGFCEFSIRHEYVESTEARPVTYLEGVYVSEEYRLSGIGSGFIALGEQWATSMGCAQMASDCEIDNTGSLAFHLGCGFTEANRIICFVKTINCNRQTDSGVTHAHHD